MLIRILHGLLSFVKQRCSAIFAAPLVMIWQQKIAQFVAVNEGNQMISALQKATILAVSTEYVCILNEGIKMCL